MSHEFTSVLQAYGLPPATVPVPFGSGLINHTWKLSGQDRHYILQQVNNQVFKRPEDIAHNIREIGDHLRTHHPDYLFVAPLPSLNGEPMVQDERGGYFRLFPFIEGSSTITVVDAPERAYEAAAAFGRFTRLLSGFDVGRLKATIPSFHDLSLRYRQFLEALRSGDRTRIREAGSEIDYIRQQQPIADEFEAIKNDKDFRIRVTHHDTKISNVLFDEQGKGLCVIDLDTTMPGYFISDVGDMMRTYLPPVSEEETDLQKVEVRDAIFSAIVRGYTEAMGPELTAKETAHFAYAGKFMIYMQAIIFLTDFLNNDVYYGAKYPQHNLRRSANQIRLLQQLTEKENQLLAALSPTGSSRTNGTTGS